jgi:hypothetical protein
MAGGRTAEVVVDDLDVGPAEISQPITHAVLEGSTLAIVLDLVIGRLPHLEDGFALPMVRPDLVRCHRSSPPEADDDREGRARG